MFWAEHFWIGGAEGTIGGHRHKTSLSTAVNISKEKFSLGFCWKGRYFLSHGLQFAKKGHLNRWDKYWGTRGLLSSFTHRLTSADLLQPVRGTDIAVDCISDGEESKGNQLCSCKRWGFSCILWGSAFLAAAKPALDGRTEYQLICWEEISLFQVMWRGSGIGPLSGIVHLYVWSYFALFYPII